MSTAYWSCAAITTLSACISLFFSIRAIRSSTGLARITAQYATARSLPLAAVALVSFFHHSRPWLTAIAVTMVLVQALDAGIGVRLRDKQFTWGPASTATLNLAALLWLLFP